MQEPLLVIATANRGKFREFADLFQDLPLRLRSLTGVRGVPVVTEDGTTYADNALRKALTVARWSGCAALADDSGLEVDALDAAPGVRSARYAGPERDDRANVAKLLAALHEIPAAGRTARFRCVLAVASPDGGTWTVGGTCEGRIAEAPRGSGGFGYDRVFFYPPLGATLAEIPAAAKNAVSHRARACATLRNNLLPFLATHAGACHGCRLD
ncbi:MAG: XTP/dITP diphosphatase [Candidatus Binatia bacterium]